jgi:hypothetical protein
LHPHVADSQVGTVQGVFKRTALISEAAAIGRLQATHGGTANSVGRDPGDGATWEVEVTTPDGPMVDVRLDGAYRVVVIEGDQEDTGRHPDGQPELRPAMRPACRNGLKYSVHGKSASAGSTSTHRGDACCSNASPPRAVQ